MIVMPVRQYDGANGGLLLAQHTVQMLNILWHILVPGVDQNTPVVCRNNKYNYQF